MRPNCITEGGFKCEGRRKPGGGPGPQAWDCRAEEQAIPAICKEDLEMDWEEWDI